MTRNFTFKEFAAFTKKIVESYPQYEKATLTQLGAFLEEDAKGRIGHLQKGGVLYGNWAELAARTKTEKEEKGYVFNDEFNPLFRTGVMRDSISYTVAPHMMILGSYDPVMVFHEFGDASRNLPARPVLGLTMYKNKINIERTLGSFLLLWLTQKPPLYKMVKYD